MRSLRSPSRRSSRTTFSPSSSSRVSPQGHQTADEQIALPVREQVALIEGHAGGRDHRRPLDDRLLHAGLVGALVDTRARIIDAVTDHRPAVILAGLRDVDLVAAARAVLVHPHLARRRIERGALRIAVAVAPDFRLGAGLFHERIVRRHRSVGAHAHDLADVIGEILRLVARAVMVAHGQEQIVVRHLHDAAAEMIAARQRPILLEDRLDVVEPRRFVGHQCRARHGRARAAVGRFGDSRNRLCGSARNCDRG